VSLYLPDEVTEKLAAYIATLVPVARYAPWADAAWRPTDVPLFLQAVPAGQAPLCFSLKDDSLTVANEDADTITWRAEMVLEFLFPQNPANAKAEWNAAGLAGHCLLAHLRRHTSDWPKGIDIPASKAISLRRSPISGWLDCSLTFPVVYTSPLTWS